MKISTSVTVFVLALLVSGGADAKAKKIDDYHWTNVDRVVAIADIHGDYGQYIKAMRSAGLIDESGKWSGGETHLVQTGDVPDRGPDTIKIIDDLVKLRKQAKKAGGYVHLLIGNHEAMNVEGDLRYVTPAEFAAFTTKNSARYRELQWQRQLEWMKANTPNFAELDLDAYRKEWEKQVPLGWVEHRQAWSVNGEYGKYVEGNQVAVQINDTIFLHGGISAKYCKLSLETMTDEVHSALKQNDRTVQTIVDDPLGPLWYRGLALEKESDEIFSQTLDNILDRYGAKRIVVGHTPTGGVVWPRFDRRVIVNDTGLATYYGAHMGVLELTADGITAIYGDKKIPIPADDAGRVDYLRAVIEADPNNAQMKQRLARMLAPADEQAEGDPDGEPEDQSDTGEPSSGEVSRVPGTCQ
jgi:hypothetical protein